MPSTTFKLPYISSMHDIINLAKKKKFLPGEMVHTDELYWVASKMREEIETEIQ